MGGHDDGEGKRLPTNQQTLKFNPAEVNCRVCAHSPTERSTAAADYRFAPECRNIIAMLTSLAIEMVRLLELSARGFGKTSIHDF